MPNLSLPGYLIIGILLLGCGWAVDHEIAKAKFESLQADYLAKEAQAQTKARQQEIDQRQQIENVTNDYQKQIDILATRPAPGVVYVNAKCPRSVSTAPTDSQGTLTEVRAELSPETAGRITAIGDEIDRKILQLNALITICAR